MNYIENKNILESLLNDIISDNRLDNYKMNIQQMFESIMMDMKKKQFDYSTFDDMNKEILYELNLYISNILTRNKEKKKTKIQSMYENEYDNQLFLNNRNNAINEPIDVSNKALMKERRNKFEKELDMKQKEFSKFAPKRPKNIDFTDDSLFQNEKVDDILNRTLMMRNEEITFNDSDKEKAKEWLKSGGPSQQSIPMSQTNEIRHIHKQDNVDNNQIEKKIKIYYNDNNDSLQVKKNFNNIKPSKKVSFHEEENTPKSNSLSQSYNSNIQTTEKSKSSLSYEVEMENMILQNGYEIPSSQKKNIDNKPTNIIKSHNQVSNETSKLKNFFKGRLKKQQDVISPTQEKIDDFIQKENTMLRETLQINVLLEKIDTLTDKYTLLERKNNELLEKCNKLIEMQQSHIHINVTE